MVNERTDSERLAAIEGVVVRLERQLFGNGQPGVISTLGKRVSSLEWYLALAVGGGAAILWIVEVLT